jgi:ferredoxin
VPPILLHGADWFAAMGTEKSKGFGIFQPVRATSTNPGQFEAPLGITLRELLDMAGGMRGGHQLKFWTPGGSSTPICSPRNTSTSRSTSTRSPRRGSMLGTRALQIFDETTCVVRAVAAGPTSTSTSPAASAPRAARARGGCKQIMERLEHGQGSPSDLEKLLDICDNILGRSFCALGDGATSPVTSSIKYFREEFERHLTPGRSSVRSPEPRSSSQGDRVRMTVPTSPRTRRRRPAPAPPPDMVTLTIDGVTVSVPKGTLIIRAAEQAGIEIPRFCDHPLLDPVGACRQCLVEVAMPGPPDRQAGRRAPDAGCPDGSRRPPAP